jgi:broad specificity phosphatase PhoE
MHFGRRRNLAVAIGAGSLVIGLGAGFGERRGETVVLVVRHAEKAASPADDPPLSEAGFERAKALAHVLANAGVKAIFVTQYQRTQQTVAPIAEALNIAVTQVDAAAADLLAARIRAEHQGQVVLIAGHSNTVPQIIAALGGGSVGPIADADFDELFVVYVPESGAAKVLRLQYGAGG